MDDMTQNIAASFQFNDGENNIKCQQTGCNNAGIIKCYLPGDYNEITCEMGPDICEYLCPEHAGESGYCTGCGTFIAGWIEYGTLCDNCRDELDNDYCEPEEYY